MDIVLKDCKVATGASGLAPIVFRSRHFKKGSKIFVLFSLDKNHIRECKLSASAECVVS